MNKIDRIIHIIRQIHEEAPTTNVGGGQIAGIGVGPKGEPGINKKKKLIPFMAFVRRKPPAGM